MSFNSPIYFIFLIIIYFFFLKVNNNFRKIYLLLASYLFYGLISIKFLIILLPLTLVIFLISKYYIESKSEKRNYIIYAGITTVVIFLILNKYLFFLVNLLNINNIINYNFSNIFEIAGISFISFHLISFLLDLKNKIITSKVSFIDFALYISYFPKITQGPIERYKDFFNNFKNKFTQVNQYFLEGIFILTWGIYLKSVVADRLNFMINPVFDNIQFSNNTEVFISTLLYSLNIFFDFIGYTKIAIGSSMLFGIFLQENFNNPMAALSCKDFWRRWHISLSNFLQDYLFLPLNFKLRKLRLFGLILSTIITFSIAGIWHGPTICFLLFGFYHGIWLSLEIIFRKKIISNLSKYFGPNITNFISLITTFTGISLSFLLFRFENLEEVKIVYIKFFNGLLEIIFDTFDFLISFKDFFIQGSDQINLEWYIIPLNTLIITLSFILIFMIRYFSLIDYIKKCKIFYQFLILQSLIIAIINFGLIDSQPFVYFRF